MGSITLRANLSLAAVIAAAIPVTASRVITSRDAHVAVVHAARLTAADVVAARQRNDFAAMQEYRPGYPFWQHVFTLPDHSIAFGSATDGRLLALFPAKGDWSRQATWTDPEFAHVLDGERLARTVGVVDA